MEPMFTRQEKELLDSVLHEKQVKRYGLLAHNIALLVGGILLIAPVIFIIQNRNSVDHIIKTVGVYLGIMILFGMAFCFSSLFVAHARKDEKERETLVSVIKKICKSTNINIDRKMN